MIFRDVNTNELASSLDLPTIMSIQRDMTQDDSTLPSRDDVGHLIFLQQQRGVLVNVGIGVLDLLVDYRQQVRGMVAHGVRSTLKTTLKNHVFKFDDCMYVQEKGAAIGVSIAGDVAVLFMTW